MARLDRAIQIFVFGRRKERWMARSSRAMTNLNRMNTDQ